MTQEQELLKEILTELKAIRLLLEATAPEKTPPKYQFNLEDFGKFNWEAIGAQIESYDEDGVKSVIWNQKRYLRRSPSNAYGTDIFFSRCTGKDEQGRNLYERLIKFSPRTEIKARRISRDAEQYL